MKKKKKPYVSPTVISVKLDASQAILSNCSDGATKAGDGGAFCNPHGNLKNDSAGNSEATS